MQNPQAPSRRVTIVDVTRYANVSTTTCAARQYDCYLTSSVVETMVCRLACALLIVMAYRLGRKALGVLGAVARSDASLPAEVLVLRQENAVLRRQIARVRYEPADRTWFAALSALVPRARWAEVCPITPKTLLSLRRRLVARKYTPSRRAPVRPRTRTVVKALILRMARDNPSIPIEDAFA